MPSWLVIADRRRTPIALCRADADARDESATVRAIVKSRRMSARRGRLQAAVRSVRRRPLDLIDDNELARRFRRLELESKLLLDGNGDRRCPWNVGVVGSRPKEVSLARQARRVLVPREFEDEVESVGDPRLVDDLHAAET